MKQIRASQRRYERLFLLINACRDKYSTEEIVETFNDATQGNFGVLVSEEQMASHLMKAGYIIFKPETSKQAEQLTEFAETVVFPYVNEQQMCIL